MLRVGILFGGSSREREVSFAGGRTVYDNLDKTLFKPIPFFVTPNHQFVCLAWPFVYKGAIADFYDENKDEKKEEAIGVRTELADLSKKIDVAYLVLHGPFGEDGSIQGLLEWLGIPYVGSGILASALGMNKWHQHRLMRKAGLSLPSCSLIKRSKWLAEPKKVLERVSNTFEKCVIKPANEGSSLGVSVVSCKQPADLVAALNKAFFIVETPASTLKDLSKDEKAFHAYLDDLCDLRVGPGLPIYFNNQWLKDKASLLEEVRHALNGPLEMFRFVGKQKEHHVVAEAYLKGREFSCIVLEDVEGNPYPLPPTEIIKKSVHYDYRSKYLPGGSRKQTPMQLTAAAWHSIKEACLQLYELLGLQVYARIDGFLVGDKVYLNDPNTSSGLLPSSFFFHQVASMGFSRSAILTHLIYRSLITRAEETKHRTEKASNSLKKLDKLLAEKKESTQEAKPVLVLTGGASSERHISLESARNVCEKLGASGRYCPVPVFLSGAQAHSPLFKLPLAVLLKDNADDISEYIRHQEVEQDWVKETREALANLRAFYSIEKVLTAPRATTYAQLAQETDLVFIAMHGRPGEDGSVQKALEEAGMTYTGSGVEASALGINKVDTARLLKKAGLRTPTQLVIHKADWEQDPTGCCDAVEAMHTPIYPMIAKPVDEGCSTVVCKLQDRKALFHYAEACFSGDWHQALFLFENTGMDLPTGTDAGARASFLVENYIHAKGAERFLEVSVGVLAHITKEGALRYEVLAPSQTLSRSGLLSIEEKFLTGEGQNITPALFSQDSASQSRFTSFVQSQIRKAAEVAGIRGYARIDAFVRILNKEAEVTIIEINTLPGLTPATCLFHQAAHAGYTPHAFLETILDISQQTTSC